MRVRERGATFEVEDVPGMHWLLGLLFVGVGSLFVAGPLGLVADAWRLHWWGRALTAALGALGVAAGLWVLARAPRSRLRVDRATGRVRLRRWGLGGGAAWEWPLPALTAVQLLEGRDDEGGAVFQVHLHFRGARPVPLSPVWRHGREGMESAVRRLAAAADVPPINVRAPEGA